MRRSLAHLLLALVLALVAGPASAIVIPIEGFESGLGGATTSGSVTVVDGTFGVSPLDGSANQVHLSNGSGAVGVGTTETDMGLASGTIDAIFTADVDPFSSGSGPTQGSALQITFTGQASDVLQWDWAFFTNEVSDSPGNTPADPGRYTDFAWFFLDYPVATDAGGALTHANDGTVTFSSSSTSYLDETPYTTLALVLPETGTYTITVGVHDVQDQAFDSGVIVDAFRLVRGPEPSTGLLLLGGLLGLSWHARRHRTSAGR